MSNERIAVRIAEVVAAYERGEVGATAVTDSIELHEPALENVPRAVRDELHRLSLDLLRQDVSPLEAEMLGWEQTRRALDELKALLAIIR